MSGLPDDVLLKLRAALDGTFDLATTMLESVAPEYAGQYEEDALENQLLDVNLERCQRCNWWMESDNLVAENCDDSAGTCDQCREEQ